MQANSIDVSLDFADFTHIYFFADPPASSDAAIGEGNRPYRVVRP